MGYPLCNTQYISSAKYSAVTVWSTGAVTAVGNLVRQVSPSVGNERIWVCIIAGTTNATTEPTWTTSRGDKITDGTVTWMEITGQAAFNGDLASTPNWVAGAKNQNVSQGHVIKDAAGTHIFLATTANTSAGSGAEPTWNTGAVGATTADASITWTYMGTSFGAWAAPQARIDRALRQNWIDPSPAAIRRFYVGHDHAETQASSISWPVPGNNTSLAFPVDLVCVSTAGSLPPVTADLATTATVTSTGTNNISPGQGHYRLVYGIGFFTGAAFQFNVDSDDRYYENCSFSLSASYSGGSFQYNNATGTNHFKGCTFTFAHANHNINLNATMAEFDNCTWNGTTPTVFVSNLSLSGKAVFRSNNLSALGATALLSGNSGSGDGTLIFRDCKMPTSYTLTSLVSLNSVAQQVILSRCDSSGNEYQYSQADASGTLTADILTARANGAKDGGTPISWKCVTTANLFSNGADMRPPMIAEWNTKTGANVVATIYGIANASAVPTNDVCWIDIDYMGTSGNTIGSRKSSRVSDYLATTSPANLTADSTSDWTGGSVAARQNSHTYSVGDVIKLASNPGRLFFCTASSGNTASSEPGGYASAVDGGSVTDGSATFRAGCRFSLSVTLTSPQPQIAGNVYAQIKLSQKSATVYFDPLMTLA